MERVAVAHVAFDEVAPADRAGMAHVQIVEGDGLETGLRQRLAAMASDIAGAAGNQNSRHGVPPRLASYAPPSVKIESISSPA